MTTSLHLHPLVLVNISDHFTRNASTSSSPALPTIGCLIGFQESQRVSLTDSFDVVTKRNEKNEIVIEEEDVTSKLDLFRRIFPQSELLGWYSTGNEANAADMAVHKQFQTWNESPLFLLLSTTTASDNKSKTKSSSSSSQKDALPISLLQTAMQIVDDVPSAVWTPVSYKIETDDSERVTVDHVLSPAATSSSSSSGPSPTTLDPHVLALHNAISMLRSRMTVVKDFLSQTREGKIPPHHALIREANALCSQLPVLDSAAIDAMFLGELGDSLLMNYLATATKASAAMTGVMSKYAVIAKHNDEGGGSSSSFSTRKHAEMGDVDSIKDPHRYFQQQQRVPAPRLSGLGLGTGTMRHAPGVNVRGGGSQQQQPPQPPSPQGGGRG